MSDAMRTDTLPAALRAKPQTGYVPGYVPIGLAREIREEMSEFRRANLPVDLRIERAMVTSAVEVCLNGGELREQLRTSTTNLIQTVGAEAIEAATAPSHTNSVLIRRSVKLDIRNVAEAWGLRGADDAINSVLVSAAVAIVLGAEHFHAAWVKLIASNVGQEVQEGYEKTRKSGG